MGIADATTDLKMGAGKIYVGIFANGVAQGEFDLGNCTSMTLQTTDEKSQKYSAMEKTRPLLATILKKRDVQLKIVGDYFNANNNLLQAMGSEITVAQSAATVVDEVVTASAKAGYWYRLANKNVSALTVESDGVAITNATKLNYIYDPITSRIFVTVDSDIADGDDITVSYTAPAATKTAIAGGTATQILALVRFVSDNTTGSNEMVTCWKVDITPGAEVGFITEDFASWSLNGEVLSDSANHPTAPYYLQEAI